MGSKTLHRLLFVLCVVAMIAAGAATLVASDARAPYAVLSEPRKASDKMPSGVVKSPTARHDLGDPASARYVGTFHGGTYFIAEGANREDVCLVRHEPDVHVVALCTPAHATFDRPSMMTVLDKDFRRVSAVLVKDGYTTAVVKTRGADIRVPVSRNVAFFSTTRAARLEVRGEGQPTLALSIPKMRKISKMR